MSMRLLGKAVNAPTAIRSSSKGRSGLPHPEPPSSPELRTPSKEAALREASLFRLPSKDVCLPNVDFPGLGLERPSSAGPPPHRSFHEMVDDISKEYDRARVQLSEMCAENARLRHHLQLQAVSLAEAGSLANVADAIAALQPKEKASISKGKSRSKDKMEKTQDIFGGAPLATPSSPSAILHGVRVPEPQEPESPRPPPAEDDVCGGVETPQRHLQEEEDCSMLSAPPVRITSGESVTQVQFSLDTQMNDMEERGDTGRISFDEGRPSTVSEDAGRFSFNSNVSEYEMTVSELDLLPVWRKKVKKMTRRPSMDLLTPSESSVSARTRSAEYWQGDYGRYSLRRLIMRPSSRIAVAWDAFTIMTLLWDLIVIPLQAYPLPASDLWEGMEILATITWTTDIIFSFLKGYEVRGDVEMNPRAIMQHYVRTWFVFDISLVSVDWVLLVVRSGNLVDWLRFSRFRRALRLLRLARLVKHGQRFLAVTNFIQSEDSLVIFRIVWLLIALIAINHFISCGWYAIGSLDLYDDQWTDKAFDEEKQNFFYNYTTSFHWSVTQFTPASMEVTPRNPMERCYNIVCIFLGLMMFSSFVSSMTNSMTYLTKRNLEKRQQRDVLMNYMNARCISLDLRSDITVCLGTKGTITRRAVCENNVASLKSLPEVLLERLHIEVQVPILEGHALFNHLHKEDTAFVHRLCHHAMSERALAAGEELFRFGVRCEKMYIMVNGTGKYTVGYGEEAPIEVRTRQWISEASLWVTWEHRGRFNAATVCELSELNAAEFQTFSTRSRFLTELQRYARLYAAHAERENGVAEAISDLWGQRLRVMDLTQKAFRDEEAAGDENPANKLMLLWTGKEFTKEQIFEVWSAWAKREKSLRRPGVFNKLLRFWLRATKAVRKLRWRLNPIVPRFLVSARSNSSNV
mmetsp:Transcript_107891/g.270580  ORF Transcript_107891/g.270580 Transcript_107891/m.270580 type:complete len:917 (+) Transcript_107891:146-2896(+)